MKEQIVNALRTRYSNLGLGSKALDGVASYLEKTITDEKDIENVVSGENVQNLLKSIQGESDSLRSERASLARELEALKQGTSNHEKASEPKKQDDEMMSLLKTMQGQMQAQSERLAAFERKDRNERMLNELKARMKSSGSSNDAVLNLTMREVEIGDGDTVDTLAERYKSVYDGHYREFYGSSPVPPNGGRPAEGYRKGDFASEVERLEREGKIRK